MPNRSIPERCGRQTMRFLSAFGRPRPATAALLGLAFAGVPATGTAIAVEARHTRGTEAADFTFACPGPQPCRPQAGPGPADRQVDPFEGSLGRPCAYRRRETPSGPRKVRVCF
jgi:hypothetical protein